MLGAIAAFLMLVWLAYRDYRSLPAVAIPLERRLRRWRARGLAVASGGVLAWYVLVVIALGGAQRGWAVDGLGLILAGAVPLSVGFIILFAAQVGLMTYRRYPGPIPDADRDLFPERRESGRGSDSAGA